VCKTIRRSKGQRTMTGSCLSTEDAFSVSDLRAHRSDHNRDITLSVSAPEGDENPPSLISHGLRCRLCKESYGLRAECIPPKCQALIITANSFDLIENSLLSDGRCLFTHLRFLPLSSPRVKKEDNYCLYLNSQI
jgi:hypothetical protein